MRQIDHRVVAENVDDFDGYRVSSRLGVDVGC